MDGIARQGPAVSRKIVIESHPPDPGLMLVQSGQKGRPCRTAAARIVETGEPYTFACKMIQVWSLYFTSIASQVGIPHIIHKDNYSVFCQPFFRLQEQRHRLLQAVPSATLSFEVSYYKITVFMSLKRPEAEIKGRPFLVIVLHNDFDFILSFPERG